MRKILDLIKQNKIKGISADSRMIKNDYIFVAIRGNKFDGHDFVDDAIENGASVVILEKDVFVKQGICKRIVHDTKFVLDRLSNEFY